MLDALKVIIFGIVEGITEWLPISSTGHLILLEELLKLKQDQAFLDMFYVVIQLGAILAVVILYFHKLNPFSPKKTEKQKKMTWQLWIKVVIGSIPAAAVRLMTLSKRSSITHMSLQRCWSSMVSFLLWSRITRRTKNRRLRRSPSSRYR